MRPEELALTEGESEVGATAPEVLGELVWTHLDPNQDTAIIADADIGHWWDTVSDGDPAALDTERYHPTVVAAPLI